MSILWTLQDGARPSRRRSTPGRNRRAAVSAARSDAVLLALERGDDVGFVSAFGLIELRDDPLRFRGWREFHRRAPTASNSQYLRPMAKVAKACFGSLRNIWTAECNVCGGVKLAEKAEPDSMWWRVTATMHSVSTAVRWRSHRLWASITLKPGSRSRRTARKLVVAAARFGVTRPSLVRILKPLLKRLPKLKRRILARLPGELVLGFFVSSAPASDALLSERERFVHAKLKAALEKRLS